MLINIKLKILNSYEINPNQLFIIDLISHKNYAELGTLKSLLRDSYKPDMQNLYRRNFIDFYDEKIRSYDELDNIFLTKKSELLVTQLYEVITNAKQIEAPVLDSDSLFEEFWTIFPSSDKWGTFTSTRSLKQDKEGCKKKYKKILQEGYKHDEVIKALEYQLDMFKKNSSMGNNRMTFFQNSATWLNQKTFLQYIDLMNNETEDNSMEIKL